MIVGGSDQVLIVVLFYFLITMIVGLLPFGKKRVDSLDNFHSATKGISDWCFVFRSEERRVGKECVSTCRSRWSPYH